MVIAGSSASRPAGMALAATLVGIVLGVLGPFGSYLNGGILVRVAYWTGAIWLGLLFYGGGLAVAGRFSDAGPWHRWTPIGLSILVASLPRPRSRGPRRS